MTRQAGFTLLEVLVGLTILSLIIAGLSAGTQFTLRVGETQARVITRTGDLDAVERALRRAFAEAAPAMPGAAALRGAADQVAWTTTLPEAAMTGGRVDAALLLETGHRLVLRLKPHPYGHRAEAPDADRDVELLRGVDRIEIAYWRGGWSTAWTQANLPALIRIRLLFPPGDPRHWPDMVMATVLQPLH